MNKKAQNLPVEPKSPAADVAVVRVRIRLIIALPRVTLHRDGVWLLCKAPPQSSVSAGLEGAEPHGQVYQRRLLKREHVARWWVRRHARGPPLALPCRNDV
jgi:hypothetical protein